METTFKYQNKIITTPNLEKKLKRMKLTLEDIEIIPTPSKKEVPKTLELEDYMKDRKEVKIKIGDSIKIFFIKTSDDINSIVKKYYPTITQYEIVATNIN